MELCVDAHPLLDLVAFVTTFPRPLGELETTPRVADLLAASAPPPEGLAPPDEHVRGKVRDLLRVGGYKPTGRGKPASEYLARAFSEGQAPRINLAVDACNVASYWSGLPISVVDLARASLTRPGRVGLAPAGSSYVFNASGQTIDVSGLLCLEDDEGPTANAVKDAQRTKTNPATTRTLSLVWGSVELAGRAEACARLYRALLEEAGAATASVTLRGGAVPPGV
jgi:DNA/RNA-binding domain of Phe-tRNA-synthetase-like protein